jgi:hypothetical protein
VGHHQAEHGCPLQEPYGEAHQGDDGCCLGS